MKVSIVEGRRTSEYSKSPKVLVDVYRSTTTIPLILNSGAKYVIPALTSAEARSVASEIKNSVTVGEKYGIKVPGFDLNNSPYDVSRYDFSGKIAIITSTNGTKVLRKIQDTGDIFIASFVNMSATLELLQDFEDVQIVLSGRPDGSADEDIAFGEALRMSLLGEPYDMEKIINRVRRGRGTKRLIMIGGRRDISLSLSPDIVDFPCKYENGKIIKIS
ncbi:MAG: 2-phosphosulfolactate phosphatase [Candidatus Thermoplasmatota archaeon]|nr:2-phosphosulfolactate phosphatase [Candidatus Thermoplasmatota archaeon]